MLEFLDITISAVSLKEQPVSADVLKILRIVRPEWRAEDVRAKVFTGGIMNVLYGYYLDGKFDEDVVLFRIEGEATDFIANKQRERSNMQALYAADCGPALYAVFNNGLVYSYIPGETLNLSSVRDPKMGKLIAKEMCRLHTVCPGGQAPAPEWKTYCYHLLHLLPEGFPDDPEKHQRYLDLIRPKHVLRKEFDELWDHLDALNSPLMFCHNDLLAGNIIYNEKKSTLRFIDFETSMYNNEHYELACHFCEYAGAEDIDYTRYPDKSYQLDWLRNYLQCKAEQNGGSSDDVTERDVEKCYVKTNKFTLLAHFACCLWAILQAKYSTLEFDFLGFAALRLGEYFARKDTCFALECPA